MSLNKVSTLVGSDHYLNLAVTQNVLQGR